MSSRENSPAENWMGIQNLQPRVRLTHHQTTRGLRSVCASPRVVLDCRLERVAEDSGLCDHAWSQQMTFDHTLATRGLNIRKAKRG